MRSERKLKDITAGRSLEQLRTIHINVSGGQIGVLNIAGTIDTIEQNLSAVNEGGGRDLVEAIKALTEAVIRSKDLNEGQKNHTLENLEFLSSEASLPAEKRSKRGVISSVIGSIRGLISTAKDISDLWSTYGETLSNFFK